MSSQEPALATPDALTLLITGGNGMLANALRAEAAVRGHRVFAYSRADLDVTDRAAVHRALAASRPDVVVHCAAIRDVDAAEADPVTARAVNAEAAGTVATLAAARGARFVYPSTDYVFAGDATRPYRPEDLVAPLSAYGRSKLAGEEAALGAGNALVVRTSWLFGVGGRNYASSMLQDARAGRPIAAPDDQRASPTWTADLASIILTLLERNASPGVYHAANAGDATRQEFARAVLECAGLDVPITAASDQAAGRAPRPRYSVLDCSATEAIVGTIPHWRVALGRAIQAGL